jgi:hypothetical protein
MPQVKLTIDRMVAVETTFLGLLVLVALHCLLAITCLYLVEKRQPLKGSFSCLMEEIMSLKEAIVM